jgi:hypothetical protein
LTLQEHGRAQTAERIKTELKGILAMHKEEEARDRLP